MYEELEDQNLMIVEKKKGRETEKDMWYECTSKQLIFCFLIYSQLIIHYEISLFLDKDKLSSPL